MFLTILTGLQTDTKLLNSTFSVWRSIFPKPKQWRSTLTVSIFNLQNIDLLKVSKFKYLGAYLCHDQPNTAEVNHRIQLASAKSSQMSNLLQNFCINQRTRILFLNSFIRSRLVYACQCWNINLYQMNRLDVTYRSFLRRMIRGGFRFVDEQNYSYRYQISNYQLHDICGTGNLSIFVQR